MERYSLIDILDEEEKDGDIEDEAPEVRKKRRLVDSILNFMAHKNSDNQQEEDILSSLFEIPTADQTKEVELLSDRVEPEVVARVVVETRIDDLTKEIENSKDRQVIEEQIDKIKALQEIKNYLLTYSNEVEIVSSEKVEIEEFVVIDEIRETKQTETISDFVQSKSAVERFLKKDQLVKKPHHFESSHASNKKSHIRHKSITRIPMHEQTPSQPIKSLAETRTLINKLYEKPTTSPIYNELNKAIKPLASKEEYHSLVNKNTPNIEEIKKLLQKNNFDNMAQQKIISEILAGSDLETAIEKQLKNNEKTLGQTSAYIHRPSEQSFALDKKPENIAPKTKAELIRDAKKTNIIKPKIMGNYSSYYHLSWDNI